MTAEQLAAITASRWMKSMPALLEFEASNIDAEAGVIRDVVAVQEGEAKGHSVHLESEFITNIVAFDKQVFGTRGVKVRLGHPGASDDSMGTQLGFMRNPRRREKAGKMQAIYDLHLLDAAAKSPTHGDMKAWVLAMSAEAPDFIMSSIVFNPSGYYQRKPNGNKHRLEIDPDWGSFANYKEEWGNIFAEFDQSAGALHHYTDLVESGAATESLFSNTANPHLFVARLGEWLDENPDIRNFISAHPDKVQAFLDRIGFKTPPTKQTPTAMSSLKELLFGKEKTEAETALSAEQVQELRDKIEQADKALTKADADIKALTEEVKALKSGLAETEKQRDTLSAKVTELEKSAADVHTKLKKEQEETKPEHSWTKDPINQRAASMYQRQKKTA